MATDVAARRERVSYSWAQAGEKTIAPVDKFATCAVWNTGPYWQQQHGCYIFLIKIPFLAIRFINEKRLLE